MARYLSRICWNSENWIAPTGEARHLEGNSYVAQYGFGHEEWLLNFSWLINDEHYAHLVPVNKSYKRVAGQRIDLLLFTITPDQSRMFVADLKDIEVLSEADAQKALDHYRQRGWLDEMIKQVELVEGDTEGITEGNPLWLFNVRFRRDQVRMWTPPERMPRGEFFAHRHRYLLYELEDSTPGAFYTPRRSPRTTPLPTGMTTRRAIPDTPVRRMHNALQDHLRCLLVAEYGEDGVSIEEDWIDLVLRRGGDTDIIEIKTAPDARLAIREAVGQLLEYAYYPTAKNRGKLRLRIVAPSIAPPDVIEYLGTLSKRFQLPVSYHPVSLETGTCPF
ncbi:MAG: hypothetical protein JXO22_14675 [Phycisphaerae bacterium]|nr:hypothetical protein [Phycisphaerae bacterium]